MQDSDAPAYPLFIPGLLLVGFDYLEVLLDVFMRPSEVTGVKLLRKAEVAFAVELHIRKCVCLIGGLQL